MDTNEVDLELAEAQTALARAQKRKADAEEAARLAAQAALTKRLADEQERLARLKRESDDSEARAIAKRAAEAEAIRMTDAARAAETRRLEQEVEARAEAQRQEAARLETIRKVNEAAHQAEIDAANLEMALKQATVVKEEPKPATLATNPLGTILGHTTPAQVETPEISSEAHAKTQAEKDRTDNTVVPVARKTHYAVDQAASRDLEDLIRRELRINANTVTLDKLSATFNYTPLLEAARKTIAQFKHFPMSHDQLLQTIESYVETAE